MVTARVIDWDLTVEVGEGRCSADWCERQEMCPLHTSCGSRNLDGFVPKLVTDMIVTQMGILKVRTACCSHSMVASKNKLPIDGISMWPAIDSPLV